VAIKFLRGNLDGQRRYLEMLRKEILIMSELQHANILRLHGASCMEVNGQRRVVMVTGWAAQGSVAALLRHASDAQTVVTDAQLLRIAVDTARALAYAHARGIVHRDVRADNVLVKENGSALLSDWGLATRLADLKRARSSSSSGSSAVVQALGSLRWMAPEVFHKRTLTCASDVYSFGVFLWELISGGTVPFVEQSPLDVANGACIGVRPILPEVYARKGWRAVLDRCWDSDPVRRLPAAELIPLLEELLAQTME
jgi:fibroblast growth factor receptor 1